MYVKYPEQRSNDTCANTNTESNNNLSYTSNFMSDAVITALLHVSSIIGGSIRTLAQKIELKLIVVCINVPDTLGCLLTATFNFSNFCPLFEPESFSFILQTKIASGQVVCL